MQKGSAVFFIIAACLCCIIWDAEGDTMPLCPGSCDSVTDCPSVDECQCGTYIGFCGCCSYCNKCPGEVCRSLAIDRCAQGTRCIKTQGGPPTCKTP